MADEQARRADFAAMETPARAAPGTIIAVDADADACRASLAKVRAVLARTSAALAEAQTLLHERDVTLADARAIESGLREAIGRMEIANTESRNGWTAAMQSVQGVEERATRAEALHRHELGQARMLHDVVGARDVVIAALRQQLADSEARHREECDESDMLRETMAAHDAAMREMRAHHDAALSAAKRDLQALHNEVRRLGEEKAAMERHWSWRLTAPLRRPGAHDGTASSSSPRTADRV